jgi:purine-cytosine permease-like protein
MAQQVTVEGSLDVAQTELRQPLTFEQLGIGTIPEDERRSTPWTFFLTFCGTGFTLGSVIFGWLPITFGLSFWAAITSMTVGTLVALVPMAPLLVIGTQTATNNSTSSGAHFGVRGRLIGSGLGLALVLLGMVIAIWSGGQILVAGAGRLLHSPTGNGALALAYVVLTVLSAVIAIYGYHLVVRTNAVITILGAVAVLLMPIAFAGHLHTGYPGGHYALGGFTATWLLSALAVGVGGVMTMGMVVGDWSRYVSARRYPPSRFLPIALLAVVLSYVIPMGIGALVTTAFASPSAPFPQSLVTASPAWYAIVLIPMALLGNLGWSGSNIYSTGLDLEVIVPWVTRAKLTAVMSLLGIGVVLVGSLVWNASGTLSALSLILLAASAPWAAIIGVGYLRCRGQFSKADLQVFNRRETGGAYWYTGGWNLPAVVAWAVGCTFGILTVQTTSWIYTGPLGGIAGGVDVSFVGSFVIAGALYLILERAAQRLGRMPKPILAGQE